MSFRVSIETRGGRPVYGLHDDETGASARVLPSYGFNLFDLRLPLAGEVRRVVETRPGWEEDPDKPARNGVPILFPYPGRVRNARYSFEGKEYTLPPAKAPHAIHGFAYQAAWEVVEHAADPSGAHILGRFRISRQAPEMLDSWPADAQLEVRYTLTGRRLTMGIAVENPSGGPLPFGFGIHPYFRLPFDPAGDRRRTSVKLPATESWVLDGPLPSGERRSVDGRLDFRRGRPIEGLQLDDVLTGLEFDGDTCTCRLVDESLGAEFRLGFDRPFRELVVFTPPGPGGVIAVEPYTQVPDAINLQARGVDAGLRVLGPGERSAMTIVMESAG